MVITAQEALELAAEVNRIQVLEEARTLQRVIDDGIRVSVARTGSARNVTVDLRDDLSGKEHDDKSHALGEVVKAYTEAGWEVSLVSGYEFHLTLPEKAKEEETPPDGSVGVEIDIDKSRQLIDTQRFTA